MKKLTITFTQAELDAIITEHIAKSLASDKKVSILGMSTTPPAAAPLADGQTAQPELGVLFVTVDIL